MATGNSVRAGWPPGSRVSLRCRRVLSLALLIGAACLLPACEEASTTMPVSAPAPAPPPPPPEPPSPPANLRVSASGQDFLEWRWDAVEAATGYEIQFRPDGDFTEADEVVDTASATVYRRESLPAGTGAFLRVRAYTVLGELRLRSGWTAAAAATTEAPSPPQGTLAANLSLDRPSRNCSRLVWTTSNATSVSIEPDVGTVSPNGSRDVCVDKVTTYTLIASGPAGALEPSPSVQLPVAAFLTGTLTADPPSIAAGECTTLSWTTDLPKEWIERSGTNTDFWLLRPVDSWLSPAGAQELCPLTRTHFDLWSGFPGVDSGFSPTGGGVLVEVLPPDAATAQCRGVTVTAKTPRWIDSDYPCPVGYAIDVSVVADRAGDAMIADFLRPYGIGDWRIQERGAGVRHDFTLLWTPYSHERQMHSSYRGIVPMTLRACPEGDEGPVLACTDAACRVYADESEVPPFRPAAMAAIFQIPWVADEAVEIREGTTLEVPVDYEIYRPLEEDIRVDTGSRFEFHDPPTGSRREIRIHPEQQIVPKGSSGPGTLHFEVTALPKEGSQPATSRLVSFEANWHTCRVQSPNWLRLLVTE